MILSIMVTNNTIDLNKKFNSSEWEDVIPISTRSAAPGAQNITMYLKYEQMSNSLDGAFLIPSSQPQYDILSLFFLSTNDRNNNDSNPSPYKIILRGTSETQYCNGVNLSKCSNIATNGTLPLSNEASLFSGPFIKLEYNIFTASDDWQGKFKVYFKGTPNLYGFAFQEKDNKAHYPDKMLPTETSTWARLSLNHPSSNS
jgi:hypothetical protein